jgi:hypothetical protein
MRKPLHSSLGLSGFCLISIVGLSLLAGCGKLRNWYPHAQKKPDNPHSVTIGWTASPAPVAGYNVYRASPPNGPIKLTVRIVSALQYTDKTVEAGHTYSYYVTSVDYKGIESDPSKNITVTVPWTVTSPAKQ